MTSAEQLPLTLGQPVLLGLRGPLGTRWYSTRAVRREEDRVWLERPHEWPLQLSDVEGQEALLDISRPTDARYRAHGQLLAGELTEGVVGLQIMAAERVQRREFFRVETCILADEATIPGANGSPRPLRLQVTDLSAGGLAARVAPLLPQWERLGEGTPLAIGSEIWITFKLPGQGEPLRLKGRVVRVTPLTPTLSPRGRGEGEGRACDIGVEFVNPRSGDRERLIRYTLQVQADYIRRGLI